MFVFCKNLLDLLIVLFTNVSILCKNNNVCFLCKLMFGCISVIMNNYVVVFAICYLCMLIHVYCICCVGQCSSVIYIQ